MDYLSSDQAAFVNNPPTMYTSDEYLNKTSQIINKLESKLQKYMTNDISQLISNHGKHHNMPVLNKKNLAKMNIQHLNFAVQNKRWNDRNKRHDQDHIKSQLAAFESQKTPKLKQHSGNQGFHKTTIMKCRSAQTLLGCEQRLSKMLECFKDEQNQRKYYDNCKFKNLLSKDQVQDQSPMAKSKKARVSISAKMKMNANTNYKSQDSISHYSQQPQGFIKLQKQLGKMQNKINKLETKLTSNKTKSRCASSNKKTKYNRSLTNPDPKSDLTPNPSSNAKKYSTLHSPQYHSSLINKPMKSQSKVLQTPRGSLYQLHKIKISKPKAQSKSNSKKKPKLHPPHSPTSSIGNNKVNRENPNKSESCVSDNHSSYFRNSLINPSINPSSTPYESKVICSNNQTSIIKRFDSKESLEINTNSNNKTAKYNKVGQPNSASYKLKKVGFKQYHDKNARKNACSNKFTAANKKDKSVYC